MNVFVSLHEDLSIRIIIAALFVIAKFTSKPCGIPFGLRKKIMVYPYIETVCSCWGKVRQPTHQHETFFSNTADKARHL